MKTLRWLVVNKLHTNLSMLRYTLSRWLFRQAALVWPTGDCFTTDTSTIDVRSGDRLIRLNWRITDVEADRMRLVRIEERRLERENLEKAFRLASGCYY